MYMLLCPIASIHSRLSTLVGKVGLAYHMMCSFYKVSERYNQINSIGFLSRGSIVQILSGMWDLFMLCIIS